MVAGETRKVSVWKSLFLEPKLTHTNTLPDIPTFTQGFWNDSLGDKTKSQKDNMTIIPFQSIFSNIPSTHLAPYIVIKILLTIFPFLYFTSLWLFSNYQFIGFLKIFYLFIFREGKGGRKRRRETSMSGCLSSAPYWVPGPQPRHVPWLGIQLATL